MTHNNKKTHPFTARNMGFCTLDQAIAVGEAVMLTQRDFGERLERKHARLKYTLEDMGMDKFREEVEKRCGFKMSPARPFEFQTNNDRYGWIETEDKIWHYGMFIENGRIKDTPDYPLKTTLRQIAEQFPNTDYRLTGNANMYIGNVTAEEKPQIQAMMEKAGIGNNKHSALRLSAMACASLPYCALAFAESERYLPTLIEKLETAVDEAGLREDSITMRMTGCANGCARPYVAEIGCVGRAPGVYNLYLGAGHAGQRLSKLYKEAVNEDQIVAAVSPLLLEYAKGKDQGEYFGDWVIRAGHVKATVNGPDFHENLGDVLS
jgi:sulfite reductase (NADPH) hemoprotein beta-component